MAFLKLSLVQDFRISNIFEQAKLIRLITQLFPDLNPQLNIPPLTTSAAGSSQYPQNVPNDDETDLPPYEELF
jgi:hypothetical protein